MSRLARFSLFALILPAAACREDPAGPARLTILECDAGSSYSIGRTVTGELDSEDCLDPGGDAFADYYQFTVGAAGPVSIAVTTAVGSTPLVIAMLDSELEIVDFDEFAAGGSGVLGGELEPGRYIVIIAADAAGRVGRYSMSSTNTLPPSFACEQIAPITIGTTVEGTIAATDCLDPVNVASADYFRFTLAQASPVSIRVTPDDASEMVVGLSTDRGFFLEVLATTRDAPASLGGMLQPGTYIVVVAGSAAGQTGGYTIVSTATLPPIPGVPPFLGCTTPQPYTIGTPVSGTLARTDCIDASDTPVDRYDFTLAAPQVITIDLVSISFDPFLTVFLADGGLIAYDDDSGEGVNSRITISLPAGTFAIGVTGYYANSLGDYTLSTSVNGGVADVSERCSGGSAAASAGCLPRDGSWWRTQTGPGQRGAPWLGPKTKVNNSILRHVVP